MPGEPPRCRSGRSHEALGNERPRGMAITVLGRARGGTEPGLHAVWPHSSGRFSGSNRDNCSFRRRTVWIPAVVLALRSWLASLALRVVDLLFLAALTR